ncbi:SRPBCC family protein [Acidiphilium sp.]|uniref:SRPBCC family protein n=1 Tax=Acidiphilium sp. TaxID=527 RepID=UPI0025841787|nr:SRPBCC family protein [Acidiphilium sp.]
MAKVYVSTTIPASPSAVWAVVRDFNALPKWAPFVAESRIEQNRASDQVGCIRNFRLKDGGRIREQLMQLSDYDLSFGYAILESPMGVENYFATFKLSPVTDVDHTFAEWQAEFDAAPESEDALVAQVGRNVFAAGLAALKQRFSR